MDKNLDIFQHKMILVLLNLIEFLIYIAIIVCMYRIVHEIILACSYNILFLLIYYSYCPMHRIILGGFLRAESDQ